MLKDGTSGGEMLAARAPNARGVPGDKDDARFVIGCARHGLPLGEGSGVGTRAVDRDDPKADRGTP
jgi:hypothetical protein